MKYYQNLASQPVFTLKDANRVIGNEVITSKILNGMINEKTIHRIRKNLYTCVNFGSGYDYANRFQIASKINNDSFVSFHSAFEFYGYYNQMFYDMQVSSTRRFSEFEYDDYRYKCFLTSTLSQVETIQGVRVTTIERTIVDSIYMLGRVMDAEELVKCLDLIINVDESKILSVLHLYDKEILYRKVGYILSFYKDDFSLSDAFFETCKSKGVMSNKGYLVSNDKISLSYNSEWGIYAYKDLKKLAYKGGMEDV